MRHLHHLCSGRNFTKDVCSAAWKWSALKWTLQQIKESEQKATCLAHEKVLQVEYDDRRPFTQIFRCVVVRWLWNALFYRQHFNQVHALLLAPPCGPSTITRYSSRTTHMLSKIKENGGSKMQLCRERV